MHSNLWFYFLKNPPKQTWQQLLWGVKASFRKKVHRLFPVDVLIYSLSKEGSEDVAWSVNCNVLEAQNLWESQLWPHLVSFFGKFCWNLPNTSSFGRDFRAYVRKCHCQFKILLLKIKEISPSFLSVVVLFYGFLEVHRGDWDFHTCSSLPHSKSIVLSIYVRAPKISEGKQKHDLIMKRGWQSSILYKVCAFFIINLLSDITLFPHSHNIQQIWLMFQPSDFTRVVLYSSTYV